MDQRIEDFRDRLQELVSSSFEGAENVPFVCVFLATEEDGIGMSSNASGATTIAILSRYLSESTGGVFLLPIHNHNHNHNHSEAEGDPVTEAEAILAGSPPFTPGVAPGFVETPTEPETDDSGE